MTPDDDILPMQDFFYARPAADSDEHTVEVPLVTPGVLLKGRYDVGPRIGSGGMADVYKGFDELFEREVAIKVLKRERISEMMMKRVLREARASCAVDHPHMLRVTDMGFTHGAPFLVTDLLRGASLADELRRAPGGRLDWRRVVTWMLPAMEALHMAHEAGLVHRDLKPENLFLHRRGEHDVLVVLDLGIVKHVDLAGKPTRWTQSGLILGTAAYMAPEQAAGGGIDRRVDIYALGVTLYRLLSGRHLFPSATKDGPFVPMTRHMYERPPRLDDPALPPALIDAVDVALRKDPADRHPSMARFAAILGDCLASPHPAARPWRLGRAARAVVPFGLGAALLLAVQGLAMSEVTPRPPAPPEPPAPTTAARAPSDDTPPDECAEAPAAEVAACEPDLASVPPASPLRPPPPRPAEARPPRPVPPPPSDTTTLLHATDPLLQCMRAHADPETRALRVRVVVRDDGRVQTAGVVGDREPGFLDECVFDRLSRLRFAPGARRTLEHTYARPGESL